MQRTYVPKIDEIQRAWFVVDATDLPLGRLASEVAKILAWQAQANVHPSPRYRRLRDRCQR